MNTASHDYSEITDTQSPTHVTTGSTGDYHVLEEPFKGSVSQAMMSTVTGGNDPPDTNVSTCEIPTATVQEVWLQCRCT